MRSVRRSRRGRRRSRPDRRREHRTKRDGHRTRAVRQRCSGSARRQLRRLRARPRDRTLSIGFFGPLRETGSDATAVRIGVPDSCCADRAVGGRQLCRPSSRASAWCSEARRWGSVCLGSASSLAPRRSSRSSRWPLVRERSQPDLLVTGGRATIASGTDAVHVRRASNDRRCVGQSAARSASTICSTSDSKLVVAAHPNLAAALLASPMSRSTSAGR